MFIFILGNINGAYYNYHHSSCILCMPSFLDIDNMKPYLKKRVIVKDSIIRAYNTNITLKACKWHISSGSQGRVKIQTKSPKYDYAATKKETVLKNLQGL
jgi:hypothetical protein